MSLLLSHNLHVRLLRFVHKILNTQLYYRTFVPYEASRMHVIKCARDVRNDWC